MCFSLHFFKRRTTKIFVLCKLAKVNNQKNFYLKISLEKSLLRSEILVKRDGLKSYCRNKSKVWRYLLSKSLALFELWSNQCLMILGFYQTKYMKKIEWCKHSWRVFIWKKSDRNWEKLYGLCIVNKYLMKKQRVNISFNVGVSRSLLLFEQTGT